MPAVDFTSMPYLRPHRPPPPLTARVCMDVVTILPNGGGICLPVDAHRPAPPPVRPRSNAPDASFGGAPSDSSGAAPRKPPELPTSCGPRPATTSLNPPMGLPPRGSQDEFTITDTNHPDRSFLAFTRRPQSFPPREQRRPTYASQANSEGAHVQTTSTATGAPE